MTYTTAGESVLTKNFNGTVLKCHGSLCWISVFPNESPDGDFPVRASKSVEP